MGMRGRTQEFPAPRMPGVDSSPGFKAGPYWYRDRIMRTVGASRSTHFFMHTVLQPPPANHRARRHHRPMNPFPTLFPPRPAFLFLCCILSLSLSLSHITVFFPSFWFLIQSALLAITIIKASGSSAARVKSIISAAGRLFISLENPWLFIVIFVLFLIIMT